MKVQKYVIINFSNISYVHVYLDTFLYLNPDFYQSEMLNLVEWSYDRLITQPFIPYHTKPFCCQPSTRISHIFYILVNYIEPTNVLTMFSKSKVNTPCSLSIALMIMLFSISRFTYLCFLAISIFISNGCTTLLTYSSLYN